MNDMQQEHMLAARLRACGHFLYYQTGGKAGQRRILVTLLKRGSLTQKELQDELELSSGALSEILKKMEEVGLVAREKRSDDKRQVELALTQEGLSHALHMKAHYSRMLDRMFACLSAEEKDQLGEILEKLVGHLDVLKAEAPFDENAGQL